MNTQIVIYFVILFSWQVNSKNNHKIAEENLRYHRSKREPLLDNRIYNEKNNFETNLNENPVANDWLYEIPQTSNAEKEKRNDMANELVSKTWSKQTPLSYNRPFGKKKRDIRNMVDKAYQQVGVVIDPKTRRTVGLLESAGSNEFDGHSDALLGHFVSIINPDDEFTNKDSLEANSDKSSRNMRHAGEKLKLKRNSNNKDSKNENSNNDKKNFKRLAASHSTRTVRDSTDNNKNSQFGKNIKNNLDNSDHNTLNNYKSDNQKFGNDATLNIDDENKALAESKKSTVNEDSGDSFRNDNSQLKNEDNDDELNNENERDVKKRNVDIAEDENLEEGENDIKMHKRSSMTNNNLNNDKESGLNEDYNDDYSVGYKSKRQTDNEKNNDDDEEASAQDENSNDDLSDISENSDDIDLDTDVSKNRNSLQSNDQSGRKKRNEKLENEINLGDLKVSGNKSPLATFGGNLNLPQRNAEEDTNEIQDLGSLDSKTKRFTEQDRSDHDPAELEKQIEQQIEAKIAAIREQVKREIAAEKAEKEMSVKDQVKRDVSANKQNESQDDEQQEEQNSGSEHLNPSRQKRLTDSNWMPSIDNNIVSFENKDMHPLVRNKRSSVESTSPEIIKVARGLISPVANASNITENRLSENVSVPLKRSKRRADPTETEQSKSAIKQKRNIITPKLQRGKRFNSGVRAIRIRRHFPRAKRNVYRTKRDDFDYSDTQFNPYRAEDDEDDEGNEFDDDGFDDRTSNLAKRQAEYEDDDDQFYDPNDDDENTYIRQRKRELASVADKNLDDKNENLESSINNKAREYVADLNSDLYEQPDNYLFYDKRRYNRRKRRDPELYRNSMTARLHGGGGATSHANLKSRVVRMEKVNKQNKLQKRSNSKEKKTDDLSTLVENGGYNDIFGALPQSYQGELTRLKRVKRD